MTQREPNAESTPVRADGGRRIGAVLLAAGESTRFDEGNKLRAEVEGIPLVRHAAATLTDSGVDDIVVVVGHDESAVREALADMPVSIVENTAYKEGQSTSVRVGVDAARERDWDATVFALGDMPFVDSASVDALLDAYDAVEGSIAAAAYEGKRGNPVLFDATHYDALADVTGDMGGRKLVETRPDAVLVETGDAGVTQDIDDDADLSKYTD